MLSNEIPNSVKSTLWSYDINRISLDVHKKLIIAQVLNFGTKEATDWLFEKYGVSEVSKIAESIPRGQWDKKSLALWTLYLGIKPMSKIEKINHG